VDPTVGPNSIAVSGSNVYMTDSQGGVWRAPIGNLTTMLHRVGVADPDGVIGAVPGGAALVSGTIPTALPPAGISPLNAYPVGQSLYRITPTTSPAPELNVIDFVPNTQLPYFDTAIDAGLTSYTIKCTLDGLPSGCPGSTPSATAASLGRLSPGPHTIVLHVFASTGEDDVTLTTHVSTQLVTAVLGTNHQIYAKKSGAWVSLGGYGISVPSVATFGTKAYYAVTGTNHLVYVRSDATGWRAVTTAAQVCNSPSIYPDDVHGTVLLACTNATGALETGVITHQATTPVLSGGLTFVGGTVVGAPQWIGIGVLAVKGTNNSIYVHTAATGFVRTTLACDGPLGASGKINWGALSASFVCVRNLDHALDFYAVSGTPSAPRIATSFTDAQQVPAIGQPGVAQAAFWPDELVVYADHSINLLQQGSPAGFTSVGGQALLGASAALADQ
jgi:hypothetical protein